MSKTNDNLKEFTIYETVTNRWYVEAETEEQAINDYEYGKDNAYLDKVIDREVMVEQG
tara:strand:- start:791 stop:964 length:174 start_codon:yes stop_codon:yes gene_type:complete